MSSIIYKPIWSHNIFCHVSYYLYSYSSTLNQITLSFSQQPTFHLSTLLITFKMQYLIVCIILIFFNPLPFSINLLSPIFCNSVACTIIFYFFFMWHVILHSHSITLNQTTFFSSQCPTFTPHFSNYIQGVIINYMHHINILSIIGFRI